jgi:carbonic anhydrase
LDAVVHKNVELTVARIRKGSAVIAELEKSGPVKITGCLYDLSIGGIEFPT